MAKRLQDVVLMIVLVVVVVAVPGVCADNGLFPFCKSMAGDRKLPRPWGFGMTLHQQDQDYSLGRLDVDIPVDLALAQDVDVENTVGEANLKVDLWLLPFLNVFGLLGRIEGETTVNLTPFFSDLSIEYDGVVYGAGVTCAGGVGRYFGSLTAAYTDTSLDTRDSSVEAWVISPKVGMTAHARGGHPIVFWVGAMYQDADEEHEGQITVPVFGQVRYDVLLEEKAPWNYLVGLSTAVGECVSIELEGGVGDRTQLTGSVGWRF